MTSDIGATVLGYPRIGPDRELQRALESYWAGASTETRLRETTAQLRADTWRELAAAGLGSIPSNTFSYYDQVLDTACMLGAVPQRYRERHDGRLDTYFAMARGTADLQPLRMKKWFDTHYHYVVPEIGPETQFALTDHTPVEQFREAHALGFSTRPVLVGPLTFLLLAEPSATAPASFHPLDRLDDVVRVYEELLAELHHAGAHWVQLDEPAFAADRSEQEIAQLNQVYRHLGAATARPSIFTPVYFGGTAAALRALGDTAIEAVAVDMISGRSLIDHLATVPALQDKTLVAGIVDGRNVWRTDLESALTSAVALLGFTTNLSISTSCSLLHVPYDLSAETELDERIRPWLAFAQQKVSEVVTLQRALTEGWSDVEAEIGASRQALANRRESTLPRDAGVRARATNIHPDDRCRVGFAQRHVVQNRQLRLPPLPTTTIGSFPPTSQLRDARTELAGGTIDDAEYRTRVFGEIERCVRAQEELGLDVLVHGEPERHDMVRYFAEHLNGFARTTRGWVQSSGARCVRPPILYGDVSRPAPITTEWSSWAQSLTNKHVKGVLTGPVTMLARSFVRADQPAATTADQLALAIRDEVTDLEAAGIDIVQVDEPGLVELLPVRSDEQDSYLDWAVGAFRLATAGVRESTQIHTHLCCFEFGPAVLESIAELDADVTSLEAALSRMEVLDDLNEIGFRRGIGPGVHDIHAPRIPSVAELEHHLRAALRSIPPDRLWANPDCGLKARDRSEMRQALHNLVTAVQHVRGSRDLRSGD